jgi:uncharacterized membrane protein
LQVKKKRTDRSYLRPEPQPQTAEEPVAEEAPAAKIAAAAEPTGVFAPPPPPQPAATRPAAAAAPARATGAARALQQQGVRKRSDIDAQALARRDTSYAIHELRRIGILAVSVVVTLIVLGIVLR